MRSHAPYPDQVHHGHMDFAGSLGLGEVGGPIPDPSISIGVSGASATREIVDYIKALAAAARTSITFHEGGDTEFAYCPAETVIRLVGALEPWLDRLEAGPDPVP